MRFRAAPSRATLHLRGPVRNEFLYIAAKYAVALYYKAVTEHVLALHVATNHWLAFSFRS